MMANNVLLLCWIFRGGISVSTVSPISTVSTLVLGKCVSTLWAHRSTMHGMVIYVSLV